MWLNAVPTGQESTNSQSAAQRAPSALSDSDDIRPPTALSSSDAPPPSALSDDDDDFRLPSPLINYPLRFTVSAMNIASLAEQQDNLDHGYSHRDGGHLPHLPRDLLCSLSSTLAENGSPIGLASGRAVQLVVERERLQNKRVQDAIREAEERLAELLRLVACISGEGLQEFQDTSMASGFVGQEMETSFATLGHARVPTFNIENHAEDAPAEPVLLASAPAPPLRPLGEPELLLAGYYSTTEIRKELE
ncbi:hypothetical protein DHEL01_v206287 [Diaporthe helianthi]|uniref:Uncharacterized protein n=1 Tax=Diaporthe helianthi TaxID=158607 RepID=A0A2P5HYJ2_DIAHE|nr:hypothetical protein DHEL01_v206287 [Diaporthe helianthi]